jgi:outer membrane protein assembly factor BamE (lipoprotein component of BamABCDE complex)
VTKPGPAKNPGRVFLLPERGIASENIMTKRFLWVTGVALCCFGLSTAYYLSDKPNLGQAWGATPDDSGYNQDYSDATLAEVIPGRTSKAQVEALLGQPWRTTDYGEPGEDEPGHEPPEVWEWRGRDTQNGPYRIHVEFKQGIVTNIAKIPEKTGMAPARVAPAEASTGGGTQTTTPQVGPAPGSTTGDSGYNQDFSDATLAEAIPGKTTKAEVETLLGQPWRTTNFAKIGEDEPGHEEPEVWEWRGQDSQNGFYRVHIEFNPQGIVTNVAKIAEKTGTAPARVVPPSTQVSRPTARPSVIDNPSAGMFRYQAPVPQTLNSGD